MNGSRVAVASLGGTITMTSSRPDGRDVAPSLDAADLMRLLPDFAVADVQTTTLASVPGAWLTFDNIVETLDWARSAVSAGASGAVVVQGTDTIEETAYLLDLYWERAEPLIVTGAMRSAQALGADGPANLAAAIAVAADTSSRDRGVLVVLNDEIHAAARVRKNHSSAPNAFCSPGFGPAGCVVAGDAVYGGQSARARPLPGRTPAPARVALLETVLGDRGELLEIVAGAGYDGVVVAGFGVGHVSDAFADVIERASHLPVVVASRTGAGTTHESTYGFAGSESDLIARGAILAGWLDARKARILLCCLLGAGGSREKIGAEFQARGSMTADA
jgi:L-asparaginase